MRTRPWALSDELWAKVEPLIPPAPPRPEGGRRRLPDRQMFAAIVYLLRTGIRWNALPRELGASSTVHDRFQEWEQAGLFRRLWEAGLTEYDELQGIDWAWQAVDGAMTEAPFGDARGPACGCGPNPTDRGKQGTKRGLLTDGAGIPLAVAVAGANRHDMRLLAATLDGLAIARPAPTAEAPQHLCLDKGYDYDSVREAVAARGYTAHIRGRGEETRERRAHPGGKARRWVVERTHSWLNRARRLLVRWEKRRANYLAFVHLARAQLLFTKLAVSG
jgi:putative transposase